VKGIREGGRKIGINFILKYPIKIKLKVLIMTDPS
jgi:hypothetical protein